MRRVGEKMEEKLGTEDEMEKKCEGGGEAIRRNTIETKRQIATFQEVKKEDNKEEKR